MQPLTTPTRLGILAFYLAMLENIFFPQRQIWYSSSSFINSYSSRQLRLDWDFQVHEIKLQTVCVKYKSSCVAWLRGTDVCSHGETEWGSWHACCGFLWLTPLTKFRMMEEEQKNRSHSGALKSIHLRQSRSTLAGTAGWLCLIVFDLREKYTQGWGCKSFRLP